MSKKVEKYYIAFINNNRNLYECNNMLYLHPTKTCLIIVSATVEEDLLSDNILEVTDFITGEKIVRDVDRGCHTRGLSFDSIWPMDNYNVCDYVSTVFNNDAVIALYNIELQKIKERSIKNYDKTYMLDKNPAQEHAKNKIDEVRKRSREFLNR